MLARKPMVHGLVAEQEYLPCHSTLSCRGSHQLVSKHSQPRRLTIRPHVPYGLAAENLCPEPANRWLFLVTLLRLFGFRLSSTRGGTAKPKARATRCRSNECTLKMSLSVCEAYA